MSKSVCILKQSNSIINSLISFQKLYNLQNYLLYILIQNLMLKSGMILFDNVIIIALAWSLNKENVHDVIHKYLLYFLIL